jgi:glycogen operon protein
VTTAIRTVVTLFFILVSSALRLAGFTKLAGENRDMFRFWKGMIEFRKTYSTLRSRRFFNGAVNGRGLPDVSWHGCKLNQPGWSDPAARSLAMTLGGFDGEADIHAMLNMYWDDLDFELPPLIGRSWWQVVDTSESSPRDIVDPGDEVKVEESSARVRGRSIVVLISS